MSNEKKDCLISAIRSLDKVFDGNMILHFSKSAQDECVIVLRDPDLYFEIGKELMDIVEVERGKSDGDK